MTIMFRHHYRYHHDPLPHQHTNLKKTVKERQHRRHLHHSMTILLFSYSLPPILFLLLHLLLYLLSLHVA